jgi:spore maturation protein CgeB
VIKKLVRDYNGKKTEEANVILEDIEEAIYQYKFYEQRYKNEKKKKRLEVLEKAENKKDRFKKLFRENKIEKNQQNAASIAFFALAFGFLGLYFIV